MRIGRLTLAMAGFIAAGCRLETIPGSCTSDRACRSGQRCELSGPMKNQCVDLADGGTDAASGDVMDGPGCLDAGECPNATPICIAGVCVGCVQASAQACGARDPFHSACAADGRCVECVSGADCSRDPAKAICDAVANTCGPCTVDSQCVGRPGPGVCMAHQDGRCATETETIYVQNESSCVADPIATAGGKDAPFCSMQPVGAALSAQRRVVVVVGTVSGSPAAIQATTIGEVSIIGQASGAIVGSVDPAVHLVSGSVYVRDVRLSSGASMGCVAESGAALRLEHVAVTGNPGGGLLLNGAAFVIRNTAVTNNGPGTTGATVWGGVLIQNPPSSGNATLEDVTIQNNQNVGIACTSRVMGTGVLASGNIGGVDVTPTCGFSSCGVAGPGCGATP